MSAYLTVYIHRIGEPIKDDENEDCTNMVELFVLSTTPCRELYGTLSATYYDGDKNPDPIYGKNYKVLTSADIADVHDFYKDKIDEYNKWIAEDEKEISMNNDLVLKATTVLLIDDLRARNKDIEDTISDFKSERDEYIDLDAHFSMAEHILEINKPYGEPNPYELVYSME
jgi:hypothetical protein